MLHDWRKASVRSHKGYLTKGSVFEALETPYHGWSGLPLQSVGDEHYYTRFPLMCCELPWEKADEVVGRLHGPFLAIVVVGKARPPWLWLAGVFACVSRSLKSGSAENLDALGSWCQEGSKM